MILVKAKLLRCTNEDRTFDGKTTRHYIFTCQKTDLDGSTIPVVVTTKSLESAKVLETFLQDKKYHLIPINNGRVNSYNMNGNISYALDDATVMHPDFSTIDNVMVSHPAKVA